MPILFLIIGSVFVVSSVRGTQNDLVSLLKADFTGKGNFLYWMVSILAIGAVGYIPDLKPVSRAFLVLVVIVLFLKNGGVFAQFASALNSSQTATPTTSTQQPASTTPQPTQGLSSGTLQSLQSLA